MSSPLLEHSICLKSLSEANRPNRTAAASEEDGLAYE